MKHRVAGRRLDRTTEHRIAMFRNQVTQLLRHERIVTTTPKAKELKRIADKVITLGKKGTAHARRIAFRDVRDGEVIEKLFGPIAERYASRAGGYSRIIHKGKRHGDNADMSIIELVDRVVAAAEPEKAEKAEKGEKAEKKAEKKSDKKAPAEKAPKAKAKKAKGE
jgi:large subunit ribosomal protein L17